ncbi:MAG: hypothetical protein ABEH88_05375, partial [Halobacteriales archaeon]
FRITIDHVNFTFDPDGVIYCRTETLIIEPPGRGGLRIINTSVRQYNVCCSCLPVIATPGGGEYR